MRRGTRTVTRCVAAISLVIGVAACGGGDEDADPAATTLAIAATDAELPDPDETMIPAEVSATVRVLVDRLGLESAFAAEVLALDAGYGADQIAQHASVLTPQGAIPGVAPTGPPAGVFAAAAAQPQGLRLPAEKTPAQALANLKAKAYDRDTVETLLGTVLFLAGVGYSAEQILDGLLFGEQRYARTALPGIDYDGPDYYRCILLAEQDGRLIKPAGPSTMIGRASNCAAGVRSGIEVLVVINGKWVEAVTPRDDNAATEPAGSTDPAAATDAYPRVFRGDGLYRITFYDSDSDGTKICEDDVEIELRLEADGRALFTYSPGMGMVREGEAYECREAAGNAWTGTYDAAAGTFTIAPPAEDPEREYWDVGGEFDDSSAFGPAGYSRLHPYADESGFQRNTYDFEFSIPRVP